MEESLRILKPYLRGLPLIVVAMITGYLVMAQYLNYVTPKYESITRLRLADIEEGVPHSNLYKDFDVFATSNKIAAEVEVLKSDMLINKALNRLDFDIEVYRVGKMRTTELYSDSPVKVEVISLKSRFYDQIFDLYLQDDRSYTLFHPNGTKYHAELGDTLHTEGAKLHLSLNKALLESRNGIQVADHYQFKKLSRRELSSQIKNNLSILPVDRDVPVIRLVFASPHPVKAARFPDILAEAYIEDYISSKTEAARITMNFLEDQIRDVNAKLSGIELDIEAYRNQKEITNIHQETETLLREISQMKIQQTNLKMNLESINELDEYIKSGADNFTELAPNFEAFTDLLSTELIKMIKELRAEKRDLLLIYTPSEERVRVIDHKLNDIFEYLIESIGNTRRNLEIKYENLSRDLQLSELQLVDFPEKERRLTILKREFEIYQSSYNFLNEKKIEAEIAHAASISFHRVIEQARIPQAPFSPNYVILKIVAALLAGGGVIVLIFLVHTLKARVNDKLTIETNSAIPIVASTPKLNSVTELQDHFLHHVNQLEIKKLIRPQAVIAVNTFSPAEGGDFHAIHAAEALSRQNRRVLLIDAGNQTGLSPLEAGAVHPLTSHLSVVHLKDDTYRFYTQENMKEHIRNLAEEFDISIITNEQLGTQKSLQLIKASDVSLVVVDSRLTPANQVSKVDLMKEEFSIDEIFFVLNRSGYNPNIVIESLNWLLKKAGLKQNPFRALTYA